MAAAFDFMASPSNSSSPLGQPPLRRDQATPPALSAWPLRMLEGTGPVETLVTT